MFNTPKRAVQQKVAAQQELTETLATTAVTAPASANSASKMPSIADKQPYREGVTSPRRQLSRRSTRNKDKEISVHGQPSRRDTHPNIKAREETAEEESAPHYSLRVAIDYGTFNLSAMFQFKDHKACKDAASYRIEPVYFDGEINSPMWLHVTPDNDLL